MSKANFVNELSALISNYVDADYKALVYKRLGDHEEYVYVIYASGAQKRFCITANSNKATLVDFVRFIQNSNDYLWLEEEEKIECPASTNLLTIF